MKALSGYAEWFWLMARNWKDVENRSWPCRRDMASNLPVKVYLHASLTKASAEERSFILEQLNGEQKAEFLAVDWQKYRGHIIGEVMIIRQMRKGGCEDPMLGHAPSMGDQLRELEIMKETAPEYFSPWFFGPFGFVVKDGVLYSKPIPYKGKIGFFDIPDEIVREVRCENHV